MNPQLNDDGMPIAPMTWAERLRRVFRFDITLCPDCGGQLRWIADVTEPTLIRKILQHLRSRGPSGSRTPRADHHPTDSAFSLTG